MTRALRLGCLTCVVFALSAGTAFAKPQIAVLGLEVIDKSGNPTPTDTQVAQELTTQLRSRAKTSGPYMIAPNGDKELNDEKLLKSCDDEKQGCMQLIGKDLGADILMYGHIEKQNTAYLFSITLFDVTRKSREHLYSDSIPLSESSGPPLAGWARKIYAKLTGQNDTCIIVVKTNNDSGTILVNGAPKGSVTNGVGQVNGLSEGRYKIAVEAKDYHRWEKTDVTCTAGQTTTVPAELEKIELGTGPEVHPGDGGQIDGPVSSSRSPWPYVAIGSGALAIGSTAALLYYRHELEKTGGSMWSPGGQYCMGPAGSATPTMNAPADIGDACANGQHNSNMTYLTFGGALVFGGVAVYALVKTITNPHSEEHLAGTHRKHHEPFVVVPVVSPTTGGVTFSMTW